MKARALLGATLCLGLAAQVSAEPKTYRMLLPLGTWLPTLLLSFEVDDVGSRPVTVQVTLFTGESIDIGSRPVTVQTSPGGTQAQGDIGSRPVTVQVDAIRSNLWDVGSRPVTVQYDPFQSFEVASRPLTVDGSAQLTLNLAYGSIEPALAPPTVMVVIRSIDAGSPVKTPFGKRLRACPTSPGSNGPGRGSRGRWSWTFGPLWPHSPSS